MFINAVASLTVWSTTEGVFVCMSKKIWKGTFRRGFSYPYIPAAPKSLGSLPSTSKLRFFIQIKIAVVSKVIALKLNLKAILITFNVKLLSHIHCRRIASFLVSVAFLSPLTFTLLPRPPSSFSFHFSPFLGFPFLIPLLLFTCSP